MSITSIIEKEMNSFREAIVKITVSAPVNYNGEFLKECIPGLMKTLGYGQFFSSCDNRFKLQKDFLINDEMETLAFTLTITQSKMLS